MWGCSYQSVGLQGYDNTESSVRKASVFCLVAIYSVIGEELKSHLAQLTGSKVWKFSLFNLRIALSCIYRWPTLTALALALLFWNWHSSFYSHRWSCWICTLREPRLRTATAAVPQMCRLTASRMFSDQCPTWAFGNIVVPPPDIDFFFYRFITISLDFSRRNVCSSQSADLCVSHASFHPWLNVKKFG